MGERRPHRIAHFWVTVGAAGLIFGACERSPAPAPTPAPTPSTSTPIPAPAPVVDAPPAPAKPARFGPDPVVDGPVATALDAFFTAAVDHGFSGCVLVAVEDKVILHNAYGLSDRDAKVPVNLRTRFDVGSISKQFTAAAALRLVMQGKLSLDEPIVRWFDVETLGLIPDRNRTITLKHLLSHTSGIPRRFDVDGVDMNDRDAVVAKLLAPTFQRPPGRTHVYSNANYFILAAVIERASGMSFEKAMHELVFAPAGLTDTMICGEADPAELAAARAPTEGGNPAAAPSLASGFVPRLADMIATGNEVNAPPEDVDVPMDMGDGHYPHGASGPAHRMPFAWGHRGATGVITTAADLLKWHRVLATDSVLNDDMRTLVVTPAIRTYAMGWEVSELDNGMYSVGHGGSMIGFEADYRRYFANKDAAEKGQGAKVVSVITSNARAGRMEALRQVLERSLLKGSDGAAPALPEPPASKAPADKPVGAGVVDACLGVYALPTGGELMITPGEDGGLKIYPIGQDAVALIDPPTAHAAPIFAYASRRAERVLRAWKTGDEADIREQRRSMDENSISEAMLAEWTDRWKAQGPAPLTAIRPVASFTKEGHLQTLVILEYEGAVSELVRVLWSEDLVTGFEPADELELPATLAPERGWPRASFASSGEQWWVTLRLVFEREADGSGAAAGVTVKSMGREVRAERVK